MAAALKHVVMLKFKEDLTEEKIKELIDGYIALPASISAMKGFEWGTDVSTENLHQGFTHVFITTFDSAEGRDEYLVHDKHQEYAAVLLDTLEKVVVFDFKPTVVPTVI